MANKRVYWEVKFSGSSDLNGIYDPWEHATIPLDPENRDYQHYLLLSASDRALLIESGSALPDGVVDSPEIYSIVPLTSSMP